MHTYKRSRKYHYFHIIKQIAYRLNVNFLNVRSVIRNKKRQNHLFLNIFIFNGRQQQGNCQTWVTSSKTCYNFEIIFVYRINANNTEVRTVPQLKKKWQDLRAAAKKKEVTRRKESVRTGGGGPPTQLTTVEQKIVSLIPPCQIEGIAGGFDSGVDGSFLDYALEADPDMSTAAMATSSLTCDFNDTVTCNTTEAMCITPAGTGTSIMMEDITARKAQGPDPVADAIKQLIAVQSQILLAENRRVEIEEEKLKLLREFVHVSPLNGQNVSPIIKFF
ncbi:uncharacterized protein LOC124118137 isoform X2 [Haliotis rufescens]|uniref:uncharacterized protein LOC124118137 isoform X2 n=1 Tax=Haliotis rufescens TaxID=6454 RepID=UPI00201F0F59|nr:uncharacterized protein LOC124118137 isoform X2 [Haliotis rufescens]